MLSEHRYIKIQPLCMSSFRTKGRAFNWLLWTNRDWEVFSCSNRRLDQISYHQNYQFNSNKTSHSFLKVIFGLYGITSKIRSDNGPPFNGRELNQFMQSYVIKHSRITPLWPRSNGICVRSMRNLNKILRNSNIYNNKFEYEFESYLANYRATSHKSIDKSPHELLFKTSSST